MRVFRQLAILCFVAQGASVFPQPAQVTFKLRELQEVGLDLPDGIEASYSWATSEHWVQVVPGFQTFMVAAHDLSTGRIDVELEVQSPSKDWFAYYADVVADRIYLFYYSYTKTGFILGGQFIDPPVNSVSSLVIIDTIASVFDRHVTPTYDQRPSVTMQAFDEGRVIHFCFQEEDAFVRSTKPKRSSVKSIICNADLTPQETYRYRMEGHFMPIHIVDIELDADGTAHYLYGRSMKSTSTGMKAFAVPDEGYVHLRMGPHGVEVDELVLPIDADIVFAKFAMSDQEVVGVVGLWTTNSSDLVDDGVTGYFSYKANAEVPADDRTTIMTLDRALPNSISRAKVLHAANGKVFMVASTIDAKFSKAELDDLLIVAFDADLGQDWDRTVSRSAPLIGRDVLPIFMLDDQLAIFLYDSGSNLAAARAGRETQYDKEAPNVEYLLRISDRNEVTFENIPKSGYRYFYPLLAVPYSSGRFVCRAWPEGTGWGKVSDDILEIQFE
jgi:hypothetical protein